MIIAVVFFLTDDKTPREYIPVIVCELTSLAFLLWDHVRHSRGFISLYFLPFFLLGLVYYFLHMQYRCSLQNTCAHSYLIDAFYLSPFQFGSFFSLFTKVTAERFFFSHSLKIKLRHKQKGERKHFGWCHSFIELKTWKTNFVKRKENFFRIENKFILNQLVFA